MSKNPMPRAIMSSVYYSAATGRLGVVNIVVKCAECEQTLYQVPAGNIVEPLEIMSALMKHEEDYRDTLCSDPEGITDSE